jgi:hypothetical protein
MAIGGAVIDSPIANGSNKKPIANTRHPLEAGHIMIKSVNYGYEQAL